MKNKLWAVILLLAFILCACNSGAETVATTSDEIIRPTTEENVSTTDVAEPIIETDPNWFNDYAIHEALMHLSSNNIPYAQESLLPLVESGNAEAQYYWGYILDFCLVDSTGAGEKEALYWFNLSAEQGFPKACLAATTNEHIDNDRATMFIENARNSGLFEQSPEELGSDGCLYLAFYYWNNSEYTKAVDWFHKAVDMGNTSAMKNLGAIYYLGVGVDQDFLLSTELLLEAANRGNVDAMVNYGNELIQIAVALKNNQQSPALDAYRETGNTDIKSLLNSAKKWYQKASDAGHADAMASLGFFSGEGQSYLVDSYSIIHGVEPDWYQRAAELGSAEAMYNLGYLYKNGTYIEQDYDAAMEWFIKAYANGYEDAANQINLLLANQQGVNAYFEHYGVWLSPNP